MFLSTKSSDPFIFSTSKKHGLILFLILENTRIEVYLELEQEARVNIVRHLRKLYFVKGVSNRSGVEIL